jgi:hypothetical protein
LSAIPFVPIPQQGANSITSADFRATERSCQMPLVGLADLPQIALCLSELFDFLQ